MHSLHTIALLVTARSLFQNLLETLTVGLLQPGRVLQHRFAVTWSNSPRHLMVQKGPRLKAQLS